ncbi:MAG: cupredoxin domain-containing protein [Patescibacteria group bacterium]
MKKIIILIIVIIVLGFLWFKGQETEAPTGEMLLESPTVTNPDNAASVVIEGTLTTPAAPTNVTKEFTVVGTDFSFDLKTLAVNQGDTVKITFKNTKGFHDWKIDEFNAATKQLTADQSETIQFVADKAGSFEYYCSVGSHRAMGMKGTLTVK